MACRDELRDGVSAATPRVRLGASSPRKESHRLQIVYKIKRHADGSIERFKARLVAKGYKQIEGEDYEESFSPVAKLVIVRIIIALATQHDWLLHQLDINNAFLHGYVEEDLYLTPPPRYTQASPGQVCKPQRCLYGLKEAGRQWNK